MCFFCIFIIHNPSYFVTCYSIINVDSPGVHNLEITSDHLVQVTVSESYQAFIFSNIDMGVYNSFSLDGNVLKNQYRNMFAIAFNASSLILIRSSYKHNQNMEIFIIPEQNCNQHSFYAMSKNVFKIRIESKKLKYNLQTCGFSPSFVTNVDRKVTVGYKNILNANAQIFYGFDTKTESQKNSLKNSAIERDAQNIDNYFKNGQSTKPKSKNIFDFFRSKNDFEEGNNFQKVFHKNSVKNLENEENIQNLDDYFQNEHNNEIKSRNTFNLFKFFRSKNDFEEENNFQNFALKNSMKNSENGKNLDRYLKNKRNIKRKVKNIFNQFKFFKTKIDFNERKKYQKIENNISINQPNILSNNQSPGFLVSYSIGSEPITFSNVNTTYYVSYNVNQSDSITKIIFDRDFDVKSDNTAADGSMLPGHFDYLVYYDKDASKFIYDDQWSYSVEIDYQPNMWKIMKWAWISMILLFVVVLILIIVCLILRIRTKRCFCMKRRDQTNNQSQINETNLSNNNNNNNNNENEFETFCYSPEIDDDVGYEIEKDNNSNRSYYKRNNDDSFSSKRNDEKKKTNDFSVSQSPYQIDDNDDDFYVRNYEINESSDELPNPYGLPFSTPKKNNNDNDNK